MVPSSPHDSLAWPVPAQDVARVAVVDLQRPLRPQAVALAADARSAEHVRAACLVATMGAIGGFSAVALILGWLR